MAYVVSLFSGPAISKNKRVKACGLVLKEKKPVDAKSSISSATAAAKLIDWPRTTTSNLSSSFWNLAFRPNEKTIAPHDACSARPRFGHALILSLRAVSLAPKDDSCGGVKNSVRVIKKARPPIGGTPGGLALPDKGRGIRGMGRPLSSRPHMKAERLSSPLYLGTMALVLWIIRYSL